MTNKQWKEKTLNASGNITRFVSTRNNNDNGHNTHYFRHILSREPNKRLQLRAQMDNDENDYNYERK